VLLIIVAGASLALAASFVGVAWILKRERWRIRPIDSLPPAPWAIVLGAPTTPEGPSAILEDRLLTGVDLFLRGHVQTLLLSGDDGERRSDEVTVMRSFALSHGVPEPNIRVDGKGRTTLDTFRRAANVFGIQKAIVVTQSFHLPRALFLARNFGIEAHGFASDRRKYTHLKTYERAELPKALSNAIRLLLQPRGNKKR
jgi:SanA protein